MPYGELRVDTITFTNGGVDKSIAVSGLFASTSGNLTVTGTVSGTTANFVSGNFTTQLSGATITGNTGQFSNITGISGVFTTRISGATITGTNVLATTGSFTSLTGTTTTGTTANFATGVFSSSISGATITATSGVIASGTAAAPTLSISGDADTGLYSPAANQISITTSGTERLRIDDAGQIEATNIGSATAPTFSFTGDPNTGIYSPGADQLAISTNGSGRLFVDASGNVGFSDANPSSNVIGAGAPTLVLRGSSGAQPTRSAGICFISQDGTNKTLQYHDSGVFYTQSTTATAQAWFTNNQERLRITSAGLVGIGVSAPLRPLTVVGSGFTGNINVSDTSGGTAWGMLSLGAHTYSGTDTAVWRGGANSVSSGGNFLNLGTKDGIVFAVSNADAGSQTERARIDSSGRLLVGTSTARTNLFGGGTAPQLQVEGASFAQTTFSIVRNENISTSVPGIVLGKTRGSSNGANTVVQSGDDLGLIDFQGADGTNLVAAARISAGVDGTPGANDMPGRLVFSTTADGASSPTERMRIDSSGRVGIGTTNVSSLLHLRTANSGTPQAALRIEQFNAAATRGHRLEITVDPDNDIVRYNATGDGAGNHVFQTGGNERARIDSSGRLLVGTSTARNNFYNTTFTPKFQFEGDSDCVLSLTRNTADGSAGNIVIAKGRSNGIVSNNDNIGRYSFQAHDGTQFVEAAVVEAFVDGTPGANDMPGRLVFSTTADGASSPTERLRITAAGLVGIGTSAPTGILHVRSAATTAGWQLRLDSVGLSNESGFYRDASDNYEMVLRNGAGGLSYIKNNGGASTANLAFFAQGSERAQIDSSGRLLVGTSSSIWGGGIESIRTTGTQFVGARFSADNFPSEAEFLKSRGSTVGTNTVVQNNDVIANLNFRGADGSTYIPAAQISAQVDGTPGANDMPGRLVFSTTSDGASSPTERMRITNTGFLKASNSGSYGGATSSYHEIVSNQAASPNISVNATSGSFTSSVLDIICGTAASTAYNLARFFSTNAGDLEFSLRGDGNAFADGSWTGGGADYAEYFEWSDGNPDVEDRRGISVVLDGDKIREALAGEDPIGVISGNPSIVGDAAWNKWTGKYVRDEFGTYILEDYEVEDEEGNTVTQQRRKLNPAYNPDVEYVPREQRPEWDCVGLMGKLRIRKGQVTGSRWIKMRDINDSVEEWLVR